MIEELKAKPWARIQWKQRRFQLQGKMEPQMIKKQQQQHDIYKQPYLGCQVNNARWRYKHDIISNQYERFPLFNQNADFHSDI